MKKRLLTLIAALTVLTCITAAATNDSPLMSADGVTTSAGLQHPTTSFNCTVAEKVDNGYWAHCNDSGGVFFTAEYGIYDIGTQIRAVFDTNDPAEGLLAIEPIVYTVTAIENAPNVPVTDDEAAWSGTTFYAVTGNKSDAETLQFSLDDVDGFIGGIGQHVVVTYHNGFTVINPSDAKGRY